MIPPIANNFVAGETAPGALDHVASLNDDDITGILNLLGEHYEERPPADDDADQYVELIAEIDRSGLDCCISVKPSQIGLDVGDDVFVENLERIVAAGDERDVFVWVDMEDYTTTDVTLDAYERLVTNHEGGVGVCTQANLKRTPDDLERLAPLPGKVRLVKGAYSEPKSVSYKKKERVNEAYEDCLELMFEAFEGGIAVGSHDPAMIDHAKALHDEYGTDYEVQMLMGVRDDAQRELAAAGVPTYQYIPYGDKWFSYFYRRVRERKENALFAVRAVLS
jgi:proline dehydrogenase